MKTIDIGQTQLQLLPEKAIYIKELNSLLMADVHLGKSETFQTLGIPIPNLINQQTLRRLYQLCYEFQPENLIILGDLFHSKLALVDEVLEIWSNFITSINITVQLIIGNHDRPLFQTLEHIPIQFIAETLQVGHLLLSHEPCPQGDRLNICGHFHPCVRLKTRLDSLRLPCFYLDHSQNLLMVPSFGEFTGSYEVQPKTNTTVYVVADDAVIQLS